MYQSLVVPQGDSALITGGLFTTTLGSSYSLMQKFNPQTEGWERILAYNLPFGRREMGAVLVRPESFGGCN